MWSLWRWLSGESQVEFPGKSEEPEPEALEPEIEADEEELPVEELEEPLPTIMSLVVKEERPEADRDWYGIAPAVMYPAAVRYVETYLAGAPIPVHLLQEMAGAMAVPPEGWELARHPLSYQALTAEERAIRAAALEAARLVFTAMLREENGAPIGLHITKNDDWRL